MLSSHNLLFQGITVKDWTIKANPMTDEPIRKFKLTITIEINFNAGNQLGGIWACLSGFGENTSIITKLTALMIQRACPTGLSSGVSEHNKAVTILQAQAVGKWKPPEQMRNTEKLK
ncbi:hypothetical protein A3849_24525 [Paenibacillus sp. P46E]|nr:hypothetical protein A3849_24525 [Paenibacillus sp. P46E]